MSVLLTGALATVPAVMLAVEMLAVLTPRVPMSSVVTANPAASRYTDRDEGYVRNTSTAPVKFTSAPALEEDNGVALRLNVVPEDVYVP